MGNKKDLPSRSSIHSLFKKRHC